MIVGLARLARLARRSAWLLGFVVRKLEPCSPPRSTLSEVGGLLGLRQSSAMTSGNQLVVSFLKLQFSILDQFTGLPFH